MYDTFKSDFYEVNDQTRENYELKEVSPIFISNLSEVSYI